MQVERIIVGNSLVAAHSGRVACLGKFAARVDTFKRWRLHRSQLVNHYRVRKVSMVARVACLGKLAASVVTCKRRRLHRSQLVSHDRVRKVSMAARWRRIFHPGLTAQRDRPMLRMFRAFPRHCITHVFLGVGRFLWRVCARCRCDFGCSRRALSFLASPLIRYPRRATTHGRPFVRQPHFA